MIKNLTSRQEEDLAYVKAIVGPQENLWNRIRNSTLSPRFIINRASPEINKYLIKANNINFSTIERRKNGIIVNYYSVLNHFIWIIPYKKLKIKKHNEVYSISDEKNYIRFSHKLIYQSHINFINRIISDQKNYLMSSKNETS